MAKKQNFIRRFFGALGPGVITGAADDDPSGIATYSIAGAQFGTALLWTALLTWPLMAAVQMMCARIGMVTGDGLAGGSAQEASRDRSWSSSASRCWPRTRINIGADLAGMADAAEMLTGINSHCFVIALRRRHHVVATVWLRYAQIASALKWLALVLFAYVVTRLLTPAPTGARSLARHLHADAAAGRRGLGRRWSRILGTTISPYLFFWQASQEVEEEKAMGRVTIELREGATPTEIVDRKLDVGVGTFFSNLVMFFIILTTALTLHAHGMTHIETSRQAAAALRPLAGHVGRPALHGRDSSASVCWPSRRSPARRPMPSPRPSAGVRGSTRSPREPGRSTRSWCCSTAARRRRSISPNVNAGQAPLLDGGHQRPAGAVPAGRHPGRGLRFEGHARPAELAAQPGRGRPHGPADVRRRGGDVHLLRRPL